MHPRLDQEAPRKPAPATTPEGSENQMASLAMQLAEKRLRNGTASAQEIVYFAKLGSLTARTERDILEKQKELITANIPAQADMFDIARAQKRAGFRVAAGG